MKNSRLITQPRSEDPGNSLARATERPLKIRVVFDDDSSARSAEVLIKHAVADLECDTRSFDFDDLDSPGPGIEAARSASDTDLLVVSVSNDGALPPHVKAWLDLYLGLRDRDREGALVVLIATPAETANPDSSVEEYLETVAAIGGLTFIPSRRRVAYNSASDHQCELPERGRLVRSLRPGRMTSTAPWIRT